jgi:hypothetical protein
VLLLAILVPILLPILQSLIVSLPAHANLLLGRLISLRAFRWRLSTFYPRRETGTRDRSRTGGMHDPWYELPRSHILGTWMYMAVGTRARWSNTGTWAYTAGLDGSAKEEDLMTEPPHGRFYAQELVLDPNANAREQIQEALDAHEREDWLLVGVAENVRGEGGVMLFWDTARASFGRTTG